MSSGTAAKTEGLYGEHNVYTKHRAGIPPLGKYFKEAWNRRQFPLELARTNERASNTDTALGKLWMVMNPLLLGCVYFILTNVIAGGHQGWGYFAHLLAGLFLFYMVQHAMLGGAQSVTAGSRLVLNTPFPRILLPAATTYQALIKFLPTLIVLAIFRTIGRYTAQYSCTNPRLSVADCVKGGSTIRFYGSFPMSWTLILLVPIVLITLMFAHGLGSLFATAQVYFRDTSSFLPYFTRIWMYLSPVILTAEQIHDKLGKLANLNPLYPMFSAWDDVIQYGRVPPLETWFFSVFWMIIALVVGTLYMMSRERDFAVRL